MHQVDQCHTVNSTHDHTSERLFDMVSGKFASGLVQLSLASAAVCRFFDTLSLFFHNGWWKPIRLRLSEAKQTDIHKFCVGRVSCFLSSWQGKAINRDGM